MTETQAADAPWTLAALDVMAERERQKDTEGWTVEHDDDHDSGQIAAAAACYALVASLSERSRLRLIGNDHESFPGWHRDLRDIWPWSPAWFKPKDRRRDLVRAGALILAEIERLDRQEPR